MTLPVTFHVGAAVRMGGGVGALGAHGGGHLMVTAEAIVLEPGPLTRGTTTVDRLTHISRSVTMRKPRFAPPWMNTRLVIEDGDVVAVVTVAGWMRARLRRALHEAGYEVIEERRS